MLIESIRKFYVAPDTEGFDLDDDDIDGPGVEIFSLRNVKVAIWSHDESITWPIDVREMIHWPEENPKGGLVYGEPDEVELGPVYIYSRVDVYGPNDLSIEKIEETFNWLIENLHRMSPPGVIAHRNDVSIRFYARDQIHQLSELQTHAKSVLEALQAAQDRIVDPVEVADDNET